MNMYDDTKELHVWMSTSIFENHKSINLLNRIFGRLYNKFALRNTKYQSNPLPHLHTFSTEIRSPSEKFNYKMYFYNVSVCCREQTDHTLIYCGVWFNSSVTPSMLLKLT